MTFSDRASGSRTARVVDSVSRFMAPSEALSVTFSKSPSGCHSVRPLFPIHVANASLSQMSSHQTGVTRLPNHWWASSWEWTRA